jgi:ATP-dependent Clp protease protease subunit
MEISLKLIMSLRQELYTILAHHTGKPVKEIEKDSDKDYWMKSDEAKSYGIIDEVLNKKK